MESQIRLICGDCLDVMREMDEASIDLVFADPPFNVGKRYGNGHSDKRADYYVWVERWVEECFRVLKDTGTIYLMTIPRHLGKLYPMLDTRGVFINHINWRNVSAARHPRSFWNESQPILMYGKSTRYVFNQYAQTRKIEQKNLRWGGYSTEPKGQLLDYWNDIPFVYAGSIHHPEAILSKGTNKKAHPAQMPVDLIRRAILFSTHRGDTVLEPFGGLCAGAVACIETERAYVACEQNTDFIEIAQQRIGEAQAQLSLNLATA